jgi:transcriptional regulator with XRE-family HTH domain
MTYQFRDFIKQERENQGISQRKLAIAIGITPTYLSKIERGEFQLPSEKVIEKIADELNVDFDELMRIAEKTPNEIIYIYNNRPKEILALLRKVRNMGNADLHKLIEKL